MSAPEPPAGFLREPAGRGWLLADEALGPQLVEAGLDGAEGWEARLDEAPASVGRGRLARVALGDRRLILKRLRRGGVAGPVWRDRFAGTERLVDNLSIPLAARERGVPTPAPAALLLVPGPPGLWRGWLAQDEIDGARDLGSRFLAGEPPMREELRIVLDTVRAMHDAGVDHRDLNLGNLLTRERDGAPEVWIVDLDGARLADGPLDADRRIDAIRRLQRSWLKLCTLHDLPADDPERWFDLYARDDADLRRRYEERRAADERKLERHRRGWR